jgi:phage shock protein A
MPDEPIDAEIVPEPAPAPAPVPPPTGYTDGGVPTLDYVRDKIEGRYATALGMEELVGETDQARSLAEQEAARKKAAEEKLAEIRRSLGGPTS